MFREEQYAHTGHVLVFRGFQDSKLSSGIPVSSRFQPLAGKPSVGRYRQASEKLSVMFPGSSLSACGT